MKHVINYGKCTTGVATSVAEKKYNAKYIGDFCIKSKNGMWTEQPFSVFYQEHPPEPEYSNYFGLGIIRGEAYIVDAASAFSEPIAGYVAHNGEIIYSRYRHDFRTSTDGSVTVDGGRDYTRVLFDGAMPPFVALVIDKDKLVIAELNREEIQQ